MPGESLGSLAEDLDSLQEFAKRCRISEPPTSASTSITRSALLRYVARGVYVDRSGVGDGDPAPPHEPEKSGYRALAQSARPPAVAAQPAGQMASSPTYAAWGTMMGDEGGDAPMREGGSASPASPAPPGAGAMQTQPMQPLAAVMPSALAGLGWTFAATGLPCDHCLPCYGSWDADSGAPNGGR